MTDHTQRSHRSRARLAVAAAALVAVSTAVTTTGAVGASQVTGAQDGSAGIVAEATSGPLRILLTNDDGFSAPGIAAVRDALVAAGHDVTIVAPATDQSGASARINTNFGGTIRAVEQSPRVWSVEGSPADSVTFGLDVVFADAPPDLVVSGTNFGQNSGGLVPHSGTVGAATTAIGLGVPAIAVSTERDIAAGTQPTIDAFPATAEFVVDAIETLQRSARGALLPDGQALNINFPVVTVGDGLPDGVSLTQVGEWSLFETHYQAVAPGTYVVVPGLLPFDEPVRNADTTALAADRISISVLDGDLGAGLLASGQTFLRLSPLLRR
jgi:5'-nucleotidase